MSEKLAKLKKSGGGSGKADLYLIAVGARNASTGVAEGGANIYNKGTILTLANGSTKAQFDAFIIQSDFVSSISYTKYNTYNYYYLNLVIAKAGDYLVDGSIVSKTVGSTIQIASTTAHTIVLLP